MFSQNHNDSQSSFLGEQKFDDLNNRAASINNLYKGNGCNKKSKQFLMTQK